MKLVYASRTGNVQKLIDRLGTEAVKIGTGNEAVQGDYILITYTDGAGVIPEIVETFISHNRDGLKGAAVSGNKERHPDTFCGAADQLAENKRRRGTREKVCQSNDSYREKMLR